MYYHPVPKEKIIVVFHPLEVDLLLNEVLDLKAYEKSSVCAIFLSEINAGFRKCFKRRGFTVCPPRTNDIQVMEE